LCCHTDRREDIASYNNNNNNNNNTANRPDTIIKNKREKTCALIDVAIPADRNVAQKDAEKKAKYKMLCTEIQRMCGMKCMIMPVIIGATGMVTSGLRKNLEAVPEKHSVDSLQKAAVLGTSHTMFKVLRSEPGSPSGGFSPLVQGEKWPVAREELMTTTTTTTTMMMMMMMRTIIIIM
jgi:hypothetical protein